MRGQRKNIVLITSSPKRICSTGSREKNLELLAKTLQTLLSDIFCNVLLSLNTNDIGDMLRESIHIFRFQPQDNIPLLRDDNESGNCQLWHAMNTCLAYFRQDSRGHKLHQRI